MFSEPFLTITIRANHDLSRLIPRVFANSQMQKQYAESIIAEAETILEQELSSGRAITVHAAVRQASDICFGIEISTPMDTSPG